MGRRTILAVLRLGFAALTIAAIVVQAAQLASVDRLVPANFLSFFTIQSNLIGAAVLIAGAARIGVPVSPRWDLVRGAAAFNLAVTFVVFALLLADADVEVPLPWVNTVVHGVFPIAVLIDWLVDPPGARITFRRSLWWLVYPLAWLAYTMVRGLATGWYPYPFLDPANGGYGTVAVYVVGILLFGIALAAILAAAGNALVARRLVPQPPTAQG